MFPFQTVSHWRRHTSLLRELLNLFLFLVKRSELLLFSFLHLAVIFRLQGKRGDIRKSIYQEGNRRIHHLWEKTVFGARKAMEIAPTRENSLILPRGS